MAKRYNFTTGQWEDYTPAAQNQTVSLGGSFQGPSASANISVQPLNDNRTVSYNGPRDTYQPQPSFFQRLTSILGHAASYVNPLTAPLQAASDLTHNQKLPFDLAVNSVQAVPRLGTRVVMSATGQKTYQPGSQGGILGGVEKALVGSRPIQSFTDYGKDTANMAFGLGNKLPQPVNAVVGAGTSVADALPFGLGLKGAKATEDAAAAIKATEEANAAKDAAAAAVKTETPPVDVPPKAAVTPDKPPAEAPVKETPPQTPPPETPPVETPQTTPTIDNNAPQPLKPTEISSAKSELKNIQSQIDFHEGQMNPTGAASINPEIMVRDYVNGGHVSATEKYHLDALAPLYAKRQKLLSDLGDNATFTSRAKAGLEQTKPKTATSNPSSGDSQSRLAAMGYKPERVAEISTKPGEAQKIINQGISPDQHPDYAAAFNLPAKEDVVITKKNARVSGEAGARAMQGVEKKSERLGRIAQQELAKAEKTADDTSIIRHALDTGDLSRIGETSNPKQTLKALRAYRLLTKYGERLSKDTNTQHGLKQHYLRRIVDKSTKENRDKVAQIEGKFRAPVSPGFIRHRANDVRGIRYSYGLSQEELAKDSGVALSTIQRLENGGKVPQSVIDKVSETLMVTQQRLLNVPISELEAAGVLKYKTVAEEANQYARELSGSYAPKKFIQAANAVIPQAAIDTNVDPTLSYITLSNRFTGRNVAVHPDIYKYSRDVRQLNREVTKPDGLFAPAQLAYRKAGDIVVKAIVLNPAIHGANQLFQALIASGNTRLSANSFGNIHAGPLGMLRFGKNLAEGFKVEGNGLTRHENLVRDMIEGGHSPSDYGTNKETYVRGALKSIGLEKANLGRDSSLLMKNIDEHLQTALYDTSLKSGMDKMTAIRNLERFMSDRAAVDKAVGFFSIFYHYVATMTKALYSQGRHPIANAGANANAVVLLALMMGLNKAYQDFTGNDKAHLRMPGELGVAEQYINSGKDVATKTGGKWTPKPPRIVTNHINPIIKEAVQQAFNTDLFTGKQVADTASSVSTAKQRLDHALGTLLAPIGQAQQASDGGKSVTEAVSNEFGLYTPHKRGYEAAPNLSVLNKSGSESGTGNDLLAQSKTHFANLDAARANLNASDQKAFDLLHRPTKDPVTGEWVVQPTVFDTLEKASVYRANPNVLEADTQIALADEAAGQKIDPFYKLTPDQQKAVLSYNLMDEGGAQKTHWLNVNKDWYLPFQDKRSAFFDQLPPGDPTKPQNPLKYPEPTPEVAKLQDQFFNLTEPKDRAVFMKDHPDLQAQFDAADEYRNKLLQARGYAPLKGYPNAAPELQKFIDAYMGTTDKGVRAGLRNQNPQAYKAMGDYFNQVDLYTIDKQGAVSALQGEPDYTSKEASAIHGLNYSIAKQKDGTYIINSPTLTRGVSGAAGGTTQPYNANFSSGGSNYVKRHRSGGGGRKAHVPKIKAKKTRASVPRSFVKKVTASSVGGRTSTTIPFSVTKG